MVNGARTAMSVANDMSLTRAQQILLKRSQAEAGLDDAEYRDTLELLSALPGCRSSKDPRLTDAHLDNVLRYFEAIYWQRVDSGALQPRCKPNSPFRQRGYWAGKNRHDNTSRDRFMAQRFTEQIGACEDRLTALGYGGAYLEGILNKTGPGVGYLAALRRTISAKEKTRRTAAVVS